MQITRVAIPVPVANPGAVTITNASPAVFGKTAHGLLALTAVSFTVSQGGALPAPLKEGRQYYVAPAPAANTYNVTEFPGGPLVATTSAGSGTFTCNVEVLRLNCQDFSRVGILIKNVGANALTALDSYMAMKNEHAYANKDQSGQVGTITEVRTNNAAADYTTPLYPLIRASASPVLLAAGASVLLFFDTSAVAMLSLRALAGTATTLEIEAFGSNL